MAENKMEQVAKLFGQKLGERFTVERDHDRFDCEFTLCGLAVCGAYENPYIDFNCFILEEYENPCIDFNCFILEDLLTGRAVITGE